MVVSTYCSGISMKKKKAGLSLTLFHIHNLTKECQNHKFQKKKKTKERTFTNSSRQRFIRQETDSMKQIKPAFLKLDSVGHYTTLRIYEKLVNCIV